MCIILTMIVAGTRFLLFQNNLEDIGYKELLRWDESPYYDGYATWVHVGGRSLWQNTTDAPVPRGEYTTRSDHNVMVRTNHIIVDQDRWIQDNDKVIHEDGVSRCATSPGKRS